MWTLVSVQGVRLIQVSLYSMYYIKIKKGTLVGHVKHVLSINTALLL